MLSLTEGLMKRRSALKLSANDSHSDMGCPAPLPSAAAPPHMSNQHRSQPNPLPILPRNHATPTTASNLLLAPDGGVFDSELEHRWANVKARLSAVLRNMQAHPLKTLPAEWVHIYTDVAKLYTENDSVRKRRMYGYVRQFIRDLVKVQLHHLRPLGGTVLLSEYVRRWRATMTYVQFMKRVLHHLQRFWISENANTLKHDPVRPLDKLLMFYWREDLLSNLHSIVDIALSLVDEDRRGTSVDHAAVRGIVDNFVEIGAADLASQVSQHVEQDSRRSAVQEFCSLELYIQVFEDRFLVHTRRFYKEEGALMAHNSDVCTFIKQVKVLLDDEEKRAHMLLHKDSAPRVRQAVEEQLIGNHKDFLQQHANKMIEESREDELRLVYNLLDRIEGAVDPVRAFFVSFVRQEGKKVVASHIEQLNGKEDIRHNLVLVELLVRLYLKHASMVKRCFEGANKIMLAIDDAFRGFVNRSLGAVSLSNLLAHYIDQLLRSNKPAGSLFLNGMGDSSGAHSYQQASKQEEKNEAAARICIRTEPAGIEKQNKEEPNQPRTRYINELVRILMYLDDKDMFFETHRRLFAKRLLSSHDEDMETMFITKLREQMGTTYTQRLSGMLQDIKISNTLRRDFAVHLCEKKISESASSADKGREVHDASFYGLNIDFNVHVLNALHWPSVKVSELVIPDVLAACQKTFSEFYMENTETRKLTWIHSMSTVHVKVTWGTATFMVVVSTFQACTLLLFNDSDEIPLSVVAEKLNVSCEDLKRYIKPLVAVKKSKLLTLSSRPAKRDSGVLTEATRAVSLQPVSANPDLSSHSDQRKENRSEEQAAVFRELADGGTNNIDLGPKQLEPIAVAVAVAGDAKGNIGKRSRRERVVHRGPETSSQKKRKVEFVGQEDGNSATLATTCETCVEDREVAGSDTEVPETTERSVEREEVLRINDNFRSKQYRIVIPSLMPRLATVEATVSRKNVVIDRSTQVDASIMRIMKLRKQVAHADLCAEVILKMSAMMFTPDVKLIKGRLDRLIDQDYIIRDEADARVYKYNA